MIHFDTVLNGAVDTIENIWKKEKKAKAYIIQNVYGKILVYIDTNSRSLTEEIKTQLQKEIGDWLGSCETLSDNFFAQSEVSVWEKNHDQIRERIWVIEKFLTNAFWNGEVQKNRERFGKSKLVSFYSFKGGVGRTTTMVMTAVAMAKKGKKIVLVDFDLEAPGVASLFPDDTVSKYGVLDYLIESNTYDSEIRIDEYLYPVSDYCRVSQEGGEIYIVPAFGKIAGTNAELYRKNLMRFNLDLPAYMEEKTPIDNLLAKIDDFLSPDYIFIDTRSGLHQIGGITLSRYSDLAVLFFYGSRQNTEGMKMVLPALKKTGTSFVLVNSKVPSNEEVASIEKKIYLEGSYSALADCDIQYKEGNILIDDELGEHYPLNIPFSDTLEVVNSIEQFMKAFDEQKSNYSELVTVLEDSLESEAAETNHSSEELTKQTEIVTAFSNIMNGLETAAAEDEFSTEQSLIDNFYPLKGYTFIFDTRKFLVLGQKGVGKTALFSALKNNEYAKALAKYLNVNTEQYEHTEWIVGTSQETDYTDIFCCLKGEEQVRAFLYYKTIETLLQNDSSLMTLLDGKKDKDLFGGDLDAAKCAGFTEETAYRLNEILKKINGVLKQRNVVITIIYDALDRIVLPGDRARFASSLVDMWYRNESVIQNVKSKIFLRKDIYDREVMVADKVKLKNYSVTLSWDYDQLFALVWKRAMSKSGVVKRFYEEKVAQTVRAVDGLGYIPFTGEEENKKLLAALVGTKMGSGKKASTYNWFRNRLADTEGVIVPRSMLDIFAKAAGKELEVRGNSSASNLKSVIRPKCYEDSLQEVSEKRVIDLKEEFKEYAVFLENLKDTIQRSPVEEEKLSAALQEAEFTNPQEEIKNLINIGILKRYQRRQSDPVRYHFPDIYLKGLGLQRLGMR